MTVIIKLGRIKKGSPLDKKEDGFRIFISRGLGGLRYVKTAERKLYYDDWWNGTKSGNPDLELAPSKEIYQTLIKYKTISWSEYVRLVLAQNLNYWITSIPNYFNIVGLWGGIPKDALRIRVEIEFLIY